MRVASILMLILFSILIAIAAGQDFKAFMSKHKKSYSAAEKKKREANYNKNVDKIKKKNALAAKNKHSYKFAINKLADMDQDEIEKKYMGLKLLPLSAHRLMATTKTTKTTTKKTTTTKTTTTKTTKTTTKKTTTTKITTTKTTKTTTKKTTTTKTTTTKTTTTKSTTTKPTITTTTTKPTTTTTKTTTTTPTTTTTKTTSTGFDWTAQPGKVAAIKDQGGCGSCWAFATAAVVETYWARKGNSLTEFSEQMLVDCENTSFGCSGGYPYYALAWERENGTMTEAAYSYSGVDQTCGFNKASVVAKIGSFSWTSSEATIFSQLQSNGPFLISMAANNLDFYSTGVLMASACTDPSVNHAVVVVGYGTENGVDYWKIRNSWGTWWGESGYFRMERNKNACKMVSYSAYYITA